MKSVFAVVLALFVSVVYAKPMESIERYNIILVHGAADSLSGMYCEAPDLKEAFAYYKAAEEDSNVLGMEAL
jgi:hypothetical protein